jgi:hypothetical protein
MAVLYAAPFVVAFLQMFTLAPLFAPGDNYDHGMPGEFFPMAAFIICWAFLVTAIALLLVRKDSSLSIVFPLIYLLTAILALNNSCEELQSRADRSYYFYYYSDFYGRILNQR